jgi:hypothetical protein
MLGILRNGERGIVHKRCFEREVREHPIGYRFRMPVNQKLAYRKYTDSWHLSLILRRIDCALAWTLKRIAEEP